VLVNSIVMKLDELEGEVLKLAPPTRARLAEVLLRSLDELSEAEVEALWLDEAERRERAWDAGEVEGIPAEQVMRELRSGSE
jgi:putative addiction module component (TIGR02574 family)